ncbi:hypothetical protein JB92DRAFT_2830233 [Gautieria morchelliformis]|nr:hypothetical protein JB92DRAFT_2830233 [Gautieria morchelliformis]
MTEFVYALHDFAPEHDDEVPFKAGERIEVVERDDLYGDGWWQGRNPAGKVGLFPQAYTSASAPVPEIRTPTTLQPLQEERETTEDAPVPASPPPPASSSANDTVMAATLTDVQEAIEQLAVRRDNDTDAARSFSFASTRDPETETDDDVGDDPDGQGWHKDARKALAERAEKENAKKLREEEEANGFTSPHRMSQAGPPIAVELSDESDADDEDEAALRNRHHDIHPHHHQYNSSTSTAQPPEVSLNDPPTEALQPAITVSNRASQSSLPTPTSPSSPRDTGVEIPVADPPAIAQPNPQTPATAIAAQFHQSIAPPSYLVNITGSLPSPATSSAGGAVLAVNVPLPKSPSPVLNSNGFLPSQPAPLDPQTTSAHLDPQTTSQSVTQTSQQQIPQTGPMTPPQSSDPGGSTTASIRESLRRTHPSEWSIEQVVEWLKSKNVDEATCGKFVEHEITGDVLLELDVGILKEELNITAFGKRMRIANAIVELRRPASFSSDPAVFHNGFAGVSPPGAAETNGHRQEASSITSGDARSQRLSPAQPPPKTRPAQLALSPSDSALNTKVHSSPVSMIPENAEGGSVEERGVQSETETAAGHPPTHPKRRHFLGRSFESGSSRGDKDNASRKSNDVTSPLSSIPNSPSIRGEKTSSAADDGVASTVGVGMRPQHVKGKRSVDGSKGSERLSFFSTTLGKARKPPPRYSVHEGDASPPPERSARSIARYLGSTSKKGGRPRTSDGTPKEVKHVKEMSERSKDPATLRKRNVSTTTPIVVPRPTPAGPSKPGARVSLQPGLSVLDQIGRPDHAGWLRKKGVRYNTWKLRYLVLKGPHLYYLRSNGRSETKIKGYINAQGYKVIADENANPGKYGFRIVHDTEPSHFFSSEEQVVVREWMKALMKATIDRDYSKIAEAVVSSCNIPTIPLAVAQAMNPAPRPPSPSARDATQRALRRENPNQLSSRDARVLMGLPDSENGVPPPYGDRGRLESFFTFDPQDGDRAEEVLAPAPPRPSREMRNAASRGNVDRVDPALLLQASEQELVDWANSLLPEQYRIYDLRRDLSSGLVLLRLAETIGRKPNEPMTPDSAFIGDNLEGMFKLFDFLLDHDVLKFLRSRFLRRSKIGNVSINDVKQGRVDKTLHLLRAIKTWGEK